MKHIFKATHWFEFTVLLIVLFTLFGCESSPSEISAANKKKLSSQGEVVGTLPDGRKIVRWSISNGGFGNAPHWIYMVDNSITVTLNHSEHQGKTTVNKVEVIVDGVSYVPKVEQ